jgi:hypothetical protein
MARKEREQFDWTFRGFETPLGNKPVRNWIMALSDSGRYELIDIVLYMKIRPPHEWAAEHFKPLEDGLSEIRFRDGGSTCRIYGFLVGAEKKVKNDRDSKQLAKSRRDQLERREAGFHAFSFEE